MSITINEDMRGWLGGIRHIFSFHLWWSFLDSRAILTFWRWDLDYLVGETKKARQGNHYQVPINGDTWAIIYTIRQFSFDLRTRG